MQRPSFPDVYMAMARMLAKRSTCSRLKVGCVITSADHGALLSCGYNGGAAGLENECESLDAGFCGHVHSELNAIIRCVAPRSETKRVYVTNMPCKACAKCLVNLGGVVQVSYRLPYRDASGVDLLLRAGIEITKYVDPEPCPVSGNACPLCRD